MRGIVNKGCVPLGPPKTEQRQRCKNEAFRGCDDGSHVVASSSRDGFLDGMRCAGTFWVNALGSPQYERVRS